MRDEPNSALSTKRLLSELEAAQNEIELLHKRVEHLEALAKAMTARKVHKAVRLQDRAASLRAEVARHGGFRSVGRKVTNVLAREGVAGLMRRVRSVAKLDVPAHGFSDEGHTADIFINEVVPRRREVLGSAWHIGLIRSRTDAPDLEALPALTISVVIHNSERWLPGFLSSLSGQAYPLAAIDLILVDHASNDSSVAILQGFVERHGSKFRAVRIMERPNNGFGAGHNAAISEATTDLVLVTNVDLVFGREVILRTVMAALVDDPSVACWELAQAPYEHPKYYDPVTLETPWCAHACVLLRREAVADVGGYDERIFMYGEDVELSYQLRGAGWTLRYLPWVRVTHFVDLSDTSVRPMQLGGSLAASVLLRYRYASPDCAAAAERQLLRISRQKTDSVRRQSMAEAIRLVHRDKQHFIQKRQPRNKVAFPFDEFDYIFRRDGHDLEVPAFETPEGLPLASILTRTHGPNLDRLSEAIATVLNQTYPSLEHVIVEDRGDYARAFVESTAQAYDRDISHHCSPGTGRSAAGNAGMAVARGQALMLLDNDDLIFADHASTLMAALIGNPDLVVAYSLAWEAQVAATAYGGYSEHLHTLHPSFRLKYSRTRLRKFNFIPIQAAAFRRSLFDQAGGFDEHLDALEDWHLWNNYATLGKFELVPRLTSIYHTPLDPGIRQQRQKILDEAYEPVRDLIKSRFN